MRLCCGATGKRREKSRVSRTVYNSFLISYILVLCVPLVCTMTTFIITRNSIEEKLLETNDSILSQARQTVESIFESASGLCFKLTQNETIASLIYIKRPFTTPERYNISYAIRNNMQGINAYSPVNMDFMIFFNRGEFLLTRFAKYDATLGFAECFSSSGLTYDEWRNMLSQYQFQRTVEMGRDLVYMQSIPYTGNEAVANVLVIVRKDELLARLNQIEWVANSRLSIYDSDGSLLLTNAAAPAQRSDERFTSMQIGENGWHYELVLDKAYVSRSIADLYNLNLYYMLAAVIIGSCLVVMFSRRNYKPIKEMATTLRGIELAPGDGNELIFINTSIQKLITLNSDMCKHLEIKNEQARQAFLSRMLRGRLDLESLSRKELTNHQILFDSDHFIVILLRIEDCSEYCRGLRVHGQDEASLEALDYTLIYMLRSHINEVYTGYACEVNGMIAGVVNFNEDDLEELRNHLLDIQQNIECELLIKITMAVSNTHSSFVDIHKGYEEALYAMEGSIAPENNFRLYSSTKPTSEYGYTDDTESALSRALYSGDTETAIDILQTLISPRCTALSISLDLFRCLAFNIAATYIRVLKGAGLHEEGLEAGVITASIARFDDVSDIQDYLCNTAMRICALSDARKESHNSLLLDRIVAYISSHYTDPKLCNTRIAEEMGISPAYLSRFFKRQTGKGVLEYISRLRIDEAKNLIKHNNKLTFKKVCALIGIDSTATFSRLFKKYTGVTPGQYRYHTMREFDFVRDDKEI